MIEVVVTTAAISRAKLQSNRHHQQTNSQLFTGRMPFLSPNQQCQSTEGKNITFHGPAYLNEMTKQKLKCLLCRWSYRWSCCSWGRIWSPPSSPRQWVSPPHPSPTPSTSPELRSSSDRSPARSRQNISLQMQLHLWYRKDTPSHLMATVLSRVPVPEVIKNSTPFKAFSFNKSRPNPCHSSIIVIL